MEPTGWPMADEIPPRQPGDTTAIVTDSPNLVWTEPDSSQIVPFQGSVEPLENVDGSLPPDLSTSASQLVAETNESTASDDGEHPRIVMDGTNAQISVTSHAGTHLPGPDVNQLRQAQDQDASPTPRAVDLSRWFDRVAQARRKLRQDMKNMNVLVQDEERRSGSREMALGKAPVEIAQRPTPDRPHEQDGKSESQVFVLHNPKRNGGEVSCLVNGKEYLLRPGQSHQFTDGPTWLVEFHRGGDFGNAERVLASGSFEFTVTDGGWDIAKTRRQPPPKP